MSTLRAILEQKRHPLLTNRLRSALLNYSPYRKRGLELINVRPQQIYESLILEEKSLTFGTLTPVEQEAESAPDQANTSLLQTPYAPGHLLTRLLHTHALAQHSLNDFGETLLFVTLGKLRWMDRSDPDTALQAPLLFLPVQIERDDIRTPFSIRATGEDPVVNPLLKQLLYEEYGIDLPDLESFASDGVSRYLEIVSNRVASQQGWSVGRLTAHVDFFELADAIKDQFFNDEDALSENPEDHPLLHQLLIEGFQDEEPPQQGPLSIDFLADPGQFRHVLDSSNEQSLVLFEMQKGRNQLVDGPAGSGKTQTATNAVAMALSEEKSVLVVSNKASSLNQIMDRLEQVGLDHLVLPLFGEHLRRKHLLKSIQQVLLHRDAGMPENPAPLENMIRLRDQLNVYSKSLHTSIRETGVTPFQAYNALAKLEKQFQDIQLPEFDGSMFVHWTTSQFDALLERTREVQAHCARIGVVQRHPFWGSQKTIYQSSDKPEIQRQCRLAAMAINALRSSATELAHQLGMPAPNNSQDVIRLLRTASRALEAPDLRGVQVDSDKWESSMEDLVILLETGAKVAALHEKFDNLLIPEAWHQDVLSIRQGLVAHSDKKTRVLIGDYRRSRDSLAGLCRKGLPASNEEQIEAVNAILEVQRMQGKLDKYEELAETLFGRQWLGLASNWAHLDKITLWLYDLHQDLTQDKVSPEILDYLRLPGRTDEVQADAERVAKDFNAFLSTSRDAAQLVEMEESLGISKRSFGRLPFGSLVSLFAHWEKNVDSLQDIVAFNHLTNRLEEEGLSEIVNMAISWSESANHLTARIEQARYNALLTDALNTRRTLAGFSGESHQRMIEQFCEADQEYLSIMAQEISQIQHSRFMRERLPAGEIHVLTHELEESPQRLLKELIDENGAALQEIKPVFVMTPASFAALMQNSSLYFDQVIFDDAGRINAADALRPIAHGGQILALGDSHQSGVIQAVTMLHGEKLEETDQLNQESLMDLMRMRGAYEHNLKWQYGIHPEVLIKWANTEIYNNRISVFPEADTPGKQRKLILTVASEAQQELNGQPVRSFIGSFVESLLQHVVEHPARSIGVVVFSDDEAEPIVRELERRRRKDRSFEAYFKAHEKEPFYIKTLNKVQGDLRDVIFFAVSFKKTPQLDANAQLAYTLSKEEVLQNLASLAFLSRHQCQIHTDTSITELENRSLSEQGTVVLTQFFKYADANIALHERAVMASEFEGVLANAIRTRGYQVLHRIGQSAMRVDLAIVDEDGSYLLGIQYDGLDYSSAQTARDRDRLQPAMLQKRGWRIHRVWSVEWFRNSERELQKIIHAIEATRSEKPARTIEVHTMASNGSLSGEKNPY